MKQGTKELLIRHVQTYPELQIKDVFKFLHQSSFGCDHLLANTSDVTEHIRKEANEYKGIGKNFIEELDGDFCRVYLDWIKAGLRSETLGKLFFLSAKRVKTDSRYWRKN